MLLDLDGSITPNNNIQYIPTICFTDKDNMNQVKKFVAFPDRAVIEKNVSEIMP